ncbi:hypothetical protein BT93_F2258 [Corymbia citriodora subsp. variegata]|nr:hypothetical protein BT93_F2258 [Corymbia citriodora subsp. variegata]
MLLRRSSTPILNSWLPLSRDSSPEHDLQVLHLPRTRSLSLMMPLLTFPPHSDEPTKKVKTSTRPRALAEIKAQEPPKLKKKKIKLPQSHSKVKPTKAPSSSVKNDEDQEGAKPNSRTGPSSTRRLLSSSGLDGALLGGEGCDVVEREGGGLQTLVVGGGMGSGGSSGIYVGGGDVGGRGGSDAGDGGFGFYENNKNPGSDGTDAYYRKMIEANPGNALLLGNYAKFLKEVRGDLAKAEEYSGRAILANPNDANILSLYADVIWQTRKDSQRAESYFDRAVKTAPEDSYVLASYAKFLWDAEEEEEEEEEDEQGNTHPTDFFQGAPHQGAPHHHPHTATS